MAPEGADGEWDDVTEPDAQPPTVRMPTSKPPRPSAFETVPPVHGVLIDGHIWAPLGQPEIPRRTA